MARKKTVVLPPPPHRTNTYYVYYDKTTNAVLAATNEKHPGFTDYLEVDFDTFERFSSGKDKFSDYLLGYVKDGDTTTLKLISVIAQAYKFQNTMLEVITDNTVTNPELLVEWHGPNKEWNFFLSDTAKKRLTGKLENSKLLFFVILENDYDFLIRTIVIDSREIITKNCIGIPFENTFELNIDKINIATRLIFESQKLRIINEDN